MSWLLWFRHRFDLKFDVDPEEIGILAPYKAQVRAIRQLLKVAKLSNIAVGSVEQFQGQVRTLARLSIDGWIVLISHWNQERKVIILATTRSNEENHPRRSLGFVANRQRTNGQPFTFFARALGLRLTNVLLVAITRAEALLIVVGDPEVLGKDQLWRTFLNYIRARGGWKGKEQSWNAEEEVYVPGYDIVPRKGGVVYGDEFMGGKSARIYRSSVSSWD